MEIYQVVILITLQIIIMGFVSYRVGIIRGGFNKTESKFIIKRLYKMLTELRKQYAAELQRNKQEIIVDMTKMGDKRLKEFEGRMDRMILKGRLYPELPPKETKLIH